jgi:parallel beta-helix repeat protein
MRRVVFKLVVSCFFLLSLQAKELDFYVSPTGNDALSGTSPATAFATLERAKQAVRLAKEGSQDISSIIVFIKGGDYQLDQPLVFTPEDSGTATMPITYEAMPGETVQISGGRRITGWTQGTNGIWQAFIPEVKAGNWYFDQLWVNGNTRHRARMPKTGFYQAKGFPEGIPHKYDTKSRSFQFAKGDLDPQWSNLKDVEVIVYHYWMDSHLPIQSIDAKRNIVTFQFADPRQFSDDFARPWHGARYIVENVFEALDAPGEWYLNRGTGILYYMPCPGEDLNTVEVIAPVLTNLVSFVGNPLDQKYVQYINIKELGFSHNLFVLPKGDSNGSGQSALTVPGCIQMTGARFCSFDNCQLNNIGSYAFQLRDGCTHDCFSHNTLTHLAAGGFRANGGAVGSNTLTQTGFNTFTDNTIGYFGEVYAAAAGIILMHSQGNLISHNLIHHGFQCGISVGFVWGYMPSISRDNIIEFNHIHHIGQGLLSDMGGIYTLGVSPGTVIRNNLVHDVDASAYGGWGIYMDEGSSYELIENNVVYNTKDSAFNIHYSREVTVRNNVFALSTDALLQRQRVEPHISVFFENNIMYWTQGKLLTATWVDVPYTFYIKATPPRTRKMTKTFYIDYNLYYNPNLTVDSVKFGDESWAQWNAQGEDVHSICADPMFVDASHYDFRLKPESPAFKLGFEQIDMSTVGPR